MKHECFDEAVGRLEGIVKTDGRVEWHLDANTFSFVINYCPWCGAALAAVLPKCHVVDCCAFGEHDHGASNPPASAT